MGISEAIARVRKSAKKANLEGALASVGASLGAGLQSAAIPPRLRPAATRIASLLGAHAEPQRDLPSLERALDGQLHGQAGHAHAVHPVGEVCPFTGLRADGTLDAEVSAALGAADSPAPVEASAAESERVEASALESQLQVEASALQNEAAAVAAQPARDEPAASVEPSAKPRAASRERGKRSEPAPSNARAETGSRAEPVAPAVRQPVGEKAAPAEKGKEKLAGERPVAKTSARSANKPAAKQTNGKANQRKK